ncbi:Similar to RIBC2: RIB43A-like with coiled-coils protein 2 (Homo sapiens) [Cotesia congregata]|uniref:Similar to RIBC2: RIB43A-like with coiled-coils protein 2 (Homo sapiens) n=1 Tax=Cotesia congregata TaxID=51543 RepID=A0A8J2MRJ0_COTCN|nr:Similar to RIBC2: RIB43A-like with coiled-coils protein 2 (Homo sapiens) [Cotesia congregata]
MAAVLNEDNAVNMLKFPPTTPQDLKVAACIERKRRNQEARKQRIFDPRCQIGIDKEFLDWQIKEKERLRQQEREQECRMDEALLRSSKFAMMLEKREEEEKKKINRDINSYRQIYQRPQDRRDFDLYDPDNLKKSLPGRLADDDPRIGPSSAQKFEGEDLEQVKRRSRDKEQMQSSLMQQVYEKQKNKQEQQHADESLQRMILSRDRRAIDLERMEEECRRKLNEANAQFNRALAEEQEYRNKYEAIKDEEDKRAEIYNHLTGDFLTEAREQALSHCGPSKLLAYRYKGMTSDELKAIWNEQAHQMKEIQKMKEEQKKKNNEWDRLMIGNAYAAEAYNQQLERQKMELRKRIAEENLQLAQQQKSHQDYLNKVVYKYQQEPEFFNQFNSCPR